MRAVVFLCAACACGRIGFGDLDTSDAPPARELTGQYDPGFGSGGYTVVSGGALNLSPYAIVELAPGYVAVGVHGMPSAATNFGVVKISDTGVAGAITDAGGGNEFAYNALPLPDGRTLVVGDGDAGTGNNDDITIAILDGAGDPDAAFGFKRFGGTAFDTAMSAARDGSTIYLCGTAAYKSATSPLMLVAIDLGGAVVPSFASGGTRLDDFGPNVSNDCFDVVALAGRIFVAGDTEGVAVVAAYRPDGMRDTTFGTSGFTTMGASYAAAHAIAIAPDGDLAIAGESAGAGLLAKLSPAGVLRTSFSLPTMPGVAMWNRLVLQPDGKIITGGMTTTKHGILARFDGNGGLDPTFGNGGTFEMLLGNNTNVLGMRLDHANRLVVVGTYGSAAPLSGFFARLL